MSSQAKRIGGDWVENVDKKSGKKYYANLKTKETSWTYPAELAKSKDSDNDLGDWVERTDPKSGRKYYYNPKTSQTSWTKPSPGDSGPPASSDPADWKARKDPTTGKTYYYNSKTRQSAWQKPEGFVEEGDAEPAKASAAAPKAAPAAASSSGGKLDKFAKLRALKAQAGGAEDAGEQKPKKAVDINKLIESMSVGIGKHSIMDYARDHFKFERGMMNKKTTAEKLLSWKNVLIKKPLHVMSDSALAEEGVQAFKNIVSFMGDRPSGKDQIGHGTKMLRNTLNAPEELRDEIFAQLIKQTRKNPSAESTVKGWQLMAICAGAYPPSKKFERYLLSYCDANTGSSMEDGTPVHPGVKPYAQYVITKIRKSAGLGPRHEVPISAELQACMNREPVVIRVHFLDNKYKLMMAESWTTVRDINAMVARKLNLKDPQPFALFETSSLEEERYLDEDERILDLLAAWTKDFQEAKSKKNKNTPTFRLVYKMRLFFNILETDQAAIDLAYVQAIHDVTDSRYPCSLEDCVQLAALQAQEQYGDYTNCPDLFRGEENLAKYLPPKYLQEKSATDLESMVLKVYKTLQNYSKQEAKLNYLDFVKSWKIYGSTYFFVQPQNTRDMHNFPKEVVLAINANGILVVDPDSKDFLADYPYSEVVTWGHSAQTFVLVVGNFIRQNKIYFKTDQGVEINSLVHAYVNKILDREGKSA